MANASGLSRRSRLLLRTGAVLTVLLGVVLLLGLGHLRTLTDELVGVTLMVLGVLGLLATWTASPRATGTRQFVVHTYVDGPDEPRMPAHRAEVGSPEDTGPSLRPGEPDYDWTQSLVTKLPSDLFTSRWLETSEKNFLFALRIKMLADAPVSQANIDRFKGWYSENGARLRNRSR